MSKYIYGMRERGRGFGCQPKEGYIEALSDKTNKFWDILIYNRKLTDEELKEYKLTFIKEINKEICKEDREEISNLRI